MSQNAFDMATVGDPTEEQFDANDYSAAVRQFEDEHQVSGLLRPPTIAGRVGGPTYRWIRDIVVNYDLSSVHAIAKAAANERSGRKSIIIAYHPEKAVCIDGIDCLRCGGRLTVGGGCTSVSQGHAHVYHTCCYTSSQCRCSFNQYRNRKRRRGPFLPMSEVGPEYWSNIIQYLCSEGRQLVFIQRDGHTVFLLESHRIQDLSRSGSVHGDTPDGALEDGGSARDHCDFIEHDGVPNEKSEQAGATKRKREASADGDTPC